MRAKHKFAMLCAIVFIQGYLSGVTIGSTSADLLKMSLEELANLDVRHG